jgi:hypothetical protein
VSETTNLGVPFVAAAANQKEVVINDALSRLDRAITETFDADVNLGSVTLTDVQYRQALQIRAVGGGSPGRTVTLPARERITVLRGDPTNLHPVGFVRGITTLTLAPGETVLARTDGTTNGLVALMRGRGDAAALTDGDKGDITVSASGATWQIDAGAVGTPEIADAAVTLAKMANLATDTLIGRATAGTGAPEAITLTAAGRALIDDADAAAQRATLGLPASITTLHNRTATVAPTVTDDSAAGYSIGSEWWDNTAGRMYVARAVTVGAAVWDEVLTRAQAAALLHPGYPPGRFSFMHQRPLQATVSVAAALTLYFFPIARPITPTTIFAQCVVAGAGSAVKCAVWPNNPATAQPTGLPLVGQNAGFNTATTGVKSAAVAPTLLPPGGYWFGSIATGTAPQMLASFATDVSQQFIASPSAGSSTMWAIAQLYTDDIMARNLTGASFSAAGGNITAIGLGY